VIAFSPAGEMHSDIPSPGYATLALKVSDVPPETISRWSASDLKAMK